MAERLTAERDRATERFERYRTAVEVSGEIESLEASHPSTMALPTLREGLGRLRETDVHIRELRAALAGEVEVHFDVKEPTPQSWRPTGIAAIVVILIAVLIVAVDQLRLLPGQLPSVSLSGTGIELPVTAIIAAILIVGGAILAFVGRRQRIRALDFRRTADLRAQEIERRLRGRSAMEQELQMAEISLTNQLAALELPDLPTVEALVQAEEEHIGTILRLRAQLEGLVGREPTETLPELRDQAALEIEQKTGALEQLGPIAREPRARERLEVEVADAERGVSLARDSEAQARARVEQNAIDAEEVAAHAERASAAAEQLAALQRRTRIYEGTLKAIDTAERATIRTATRYLEQHMHAYLELITDGRYRRVQVDDKDLAIRVFAPELNDWVDASTLSQGTLDVVYLAARIGLVRLVTGDRRPPLVLDDPFVTLDDDRAGRALALLKILSSDFQVIYLTTSDRYDGAADAVCELAGPTAMSPADEGDGAGPPITISGLAAEVQSRA
jgi:hypothetical protein